MKRLILFLFIVPLLMLVYPLTADAMKMSEPTYLGSIGYEQVADDKEPSGFTVSNATKNKGKRDLKLWDKLYRKGCATYGKDELTVNVHYNIKEHEIYIGDKDKANTIETYCGDLTTINAITTDSGIVFYYVNSSHREGSDFLILGKLPDGRFVQYVDSDKVKPAYFSPYENSTFIHFNRVRAENNVIIVEFVSLLDNTINGELRFPWDQKAQWFGVKRK